MKYNTGTVAVTNGSPAVTGSGTLWVTGPSPIKVGQLFTVAGDGVFYAVGAIASDTSLTLTANYAGVTNAAAGYTIVQSFTTNYNFPYPDIGDVQTATILKQALNQIDAAMEAINARLVAKGI